MITKKLLISIVLIPFLLLSACAPTTTVQPTEANVPAVVQPEAVQPQNDNPPSSDSFQPAGPIAGTPMGWVDGSTLIFIPDPKGMDYLGSKGFWITFMPISNYQFSLCVQSGVCATPNGKGYGIPERGGDPVSIVGPDRPADYCKWILGRKPSKNELRLFLSSVTNGLEDSELSFEDLGLMPGGIFGIQDDSVRCIVDSPVPMPLFAKTTPYYNPRFSPADMEAQVSGAQGFCQNDLSYQTLDFTIPPDHSIQSVVGADGTQCEVLEDDRIVCYGPSNTNPQVEVGFLCDGCRNFPQAQCNEYFYCQPGTTLEAGACSGFKFIIDTGLKDWNFDSNGILVPVNGEILPDGTRYGRITQKIKWVNGIIVIEDTSVSTVPITGYADVKMSLPNASSVNQVLIHNYSISSPCPQGYYLSNDPLTGDKVCVNIPSVMGSQTTTECMDGYRYNIGTMRCEAVQPNGNYPGCLIGSLYYVPDAVCDVRTTIVSPTQLIHHQTFQLNLPVCETPATQESNQDDSSNPGGLTCSLGQELVCPDAANPASCYCK